MCVNNASTSLKIKARISKNKFSGVGLIYPLHWYFNIAKNYKSLSSTAWSGFVKNLFQGVVAMFWRKRFLFYCILPHLYGILSYYVGTILKNHFSGLYPQKHEQDSQKTVFQGVVPPESPPSGSLTLCVILISSSCTKMRTFSKN